MNFKDKIMNECLALLSKEEVKEKIKDMMRPLLDMILKEIYPYIYISLIFIIICFLLVLGIFILLLRNRFLLKLSKV
tara:strand:- start:462 stop:692 length:231 start_codon:yes stop_codon:yes gene_type:complete